MYILIFAGEIIRKQSESVSFGEAEYNDHSDSEAEWSFGSRMVIRE
jgi:hypothetical protein